MLRFLGPNLFKWTYIFDCYEGGGKGATLGTLFSGGCVHTGDCVHTTGGGHRWAKEGHLTKRKKLNDIFDALMVIVGELILKWERLDTCATTGSFRSRHETAKQIFAMPYEAMKDRLTTWGRDEAAHQMVLFFWVPHEEAAGTRIRGPGPCRL